MRREHASGACMQQRWTLAASVPPVAAAGRRAVSHTCFCRYFRHHIGQTVRLRLTPKVTIIHDEMAEDNERLAALIDQVAAQDRARQAAMAAQDAAAELDPAAAAAGAAAQPAAAARPEAPAATPAAAAFDGADAAFDYSSGSSEEYDSDAGAWAADSYDSADSDSYSASSGESSAEEGAHSQGQEDDEEEGEGVVWVTEKGKRVDTKALIKQGGVDLDYDSDSDDASGLQAYLASLPDADPVHDEMEVQRRQNEWAQSQKIRRRQKTRHRRMAP